MTWWWTLSIALADCDPAAVEQAAAAVLDGEQDLGVLDEALGCLQTWISPALAARVHRVRAIAHARAVASMDVPARDLVAAWLADPDAPLEEAAPWRLQNWWRDLGDQPPPTPRRVAWFDLRQGEHRLDGRPLTTPAVDFAPHLLQSTDRDGAIASTWIEGELPVDLLVPNDEMPPEDREHSGFLLPLRTDRGARSTCNYYLTDTGSMMVACGHGRTRKTWLAITGVALAAGGATAAFVALR